MNTGAPQGCVLSTLLYSRYIYDCTATSNSNIVVKYADDTTVFATRINPKGRKGSSDECSASALTSVDTENDSQGVIDTEELLKRLMEEGIDMSDDEAQRFRGILNNGRYPTHSDYIQVIKALIVKYSLRDVHGNGYDTWHSQLKRKFKAERAPLISNEEVNRVKEKFGRTQKHRTTEESSSSCLKRLKPSLDSCFVGEDAASVDAHIKVLNDQHKKLHPDTALVKDRMTKTFAWRRREVAEGMCTVDLLKRYPFLGTSAGLCYEVDLMHPCQDNICRCFSENFTAVLQMTKDLPLKKVSLDEAYISAFSTFFMFNMHTSRKHLSFFRTALST
ncbi:uncharacterized protein LOC113015528 [Astatotilapia calliptera]|uniref:uncharacterized protein LOC113015528 n=1 Tax=Astatotilapia calliptera TaxID=8154 RepID=UPI000E4287B0|nr:uncharacterized protein LOC113015528 [Astatotilapia calliptera]